MNDKTDISNLYASLAIARLNPNSPSYKRDCQAVRNRSRMMRADNLAKAIKRMQNVDPDQSIAQQ